MAGMGFLSAQRCLFEQSDGPLLIHAPACTLPEMVYEEGSVRR